MSTVEKVLRWDPKTGEAKEFEKGNVPEGFLDHHPEDPAYKNKPEAEKPVVPVVEKVKPTLNRKETIAALTHASVTFDEKATAVDLYSLLLTEVKAELVKANIEHDAASEDAKALLALFP